MPGADQRRRHRTCLSCGRRTRGAIDRASGAAGAGAFAAPVATCVSAGGGPSSRSYKHLVLVHGRLILFKFRTIKATVVYQ